MTVQELIVKMGFQVDESKLRRADNAISSMASSAMKLVGVGVVAYKAFDTLMSSIKAAANLEGMNAQFEVMLGNADAARYLTQEINKLAAETPFETPGLVDNVRLMMAFGQSAKDSLAATKMLGDVAGADQERLNRLALAYAQVMAAGKLQGQDLLQFVNAGFNPLQELSQKTGKSMAQLRKEMEKGLITSDMVVQAFQSATGPGGRFFGNMEKQSKTLNGLWSTLVDNIRMTMAELGGRMLPFLKEVITYLIGMTEGIAEAYRSLGEFFAIMFEGGPTALEIAAGIAAAFQTVADAVMAVGTAFQIILYAVDIFQGAIATMVGVVTDLLRALMNSWAWVAKGLINGGNAIIRMTGGKPTKQSQEYVDWLDQRTGGMWDYTAGTFQNASQAGNERFDKIMRMGSMIGASTPAAPGSKVALTDKILAALSGSKKVVNNTINNNVTVHGSDPLKEAADSIFGKAFQGQLLALRAATV